MDWYTGSGPAKMTLEGTLGLYLDGFPFAPTGNELAVIAFDFYNKMPYIPHSITGGTDAIYRGEKEFKHWTKVSNVSGTGFRIRNGFAVHPWNQHIFYGGAASPFTTHIIKRCDYQGNNHTTLVTHAVGSGVVRFITVSKTEEYVFYSLDTTTKTIRRCNADGTGDIEILDGASISAALLNTACVDNVGKKLFVSDANHLVYKMNFDGSGATQIFDSFASRPPLPASGQVLLGNWSHKLGRLFVWASNVSTGTQPAGLFSMKADGTDIKAEVIWPNFVQLPNPPFTTSRQSLSSNQLPPGQIRLGCGYEKTGPSTDAS